MLAKNPADRPQTPAEVAKALLPFAKGEITAPAARAAAAAEPLAKVQPIVRPSDSKAKRRSSPLRPLAGEGPGGKAWLAQLWHRCHSAIPPRFRTRGWLVAAGGAALTGVVLFGLLLKMRTSDGTLVVEMSDPQATVQVLDAQGKLLIEQTAGGEKVEIGVVPGKGKLRVVKNGVELLTKEFSLVSGGRETINARLETSARNGNSIITSKSEMPALPPGQQHESRGRRMGAEAGGRLDIETKDGSVQQGVKLVPPEPFWVSSISLDKPEIHDRDLTRLRGFERLKIIGLVGTSTTDETLKVLSELPSLENVNIWWCATLTMAFNASGGSKN